MPIRGAADGGPADQHGTALDGGPTQRTCPSGDPIDDLLTSTTELVQRWRQCRDRLAHLRDELRDAELDECDARVAVQRALHRLTTDVDANVPPGAGDHDAPQPPGPATEITMLGVFRLRRHGRVVDGLPGSRAPRILRMLAAHRGRPVPREVLIDCFWPDTDPETARRSLHQAIYQIRVAGRVPEEPAPIVVFEHDSYALNTAGGVRCDVDEVERLAAAGRALDADGQTAAAITAYRQALANHGGEYLADLPYDDWVVPERERLRLCHRTLANRLADLLLDRGDVAGALELSQHVLGLDPSDETAHRRAMRCFAASAQSSELVRQYDACTSALEEHCGLVPSTATTSLFHSLLASCGPGGEGAPRSSR